MKAFVLKTDKCFEIDKNFINFYVSLLANAISYHDVLDIFENLFQVLLCKLTQDCKTTKEYLDQKLEKNIECYKQFDYDELPEPRPSTVLPDNKTVKNEDDLPLKEDVYLQQSKRSIFLKRCEIIF